MTRPTSIWQQDRDESFEVCQRWIYCDHAGIAPLPSVATKAMRNAGEHFATHGGVNYDFWIQLDHTARTDCAELLGTDIGNISWIPNTSYGLSQFALGFPWSAGDQVVLATDEFSANVYPWMAAKSRFGIEIIDLDSKRTDQGMCEQLTQLLDQHQSVKMLAVSWAQYHTGRLLPIEQLAKICHEHQVLIVVDGIQALGIEPAAFDAWELDGLVADGHKWLLGPEGFGVMGVSKRAQSLLTPTAVGWHSVKSILPYHNIDWTPAETAKKFEPGSQNTIGLAGFAASVQMLLETGVDKIRHTLSEHTSWLRQRLAINTPEFRATAGHVFATPTVPQMEQTLLQNGVVVRERIGRLRISPHAYINTDDLEQLASLLEGNIQP